MNLKNISLTIITSFILSCSNSENKNVLANADTAIVSMGSFPNKIETQELVNGEDTLINDPTSARLKPIKENFKKTINIRYAVYIGLIFKIYQLHFWGEE